MKRPSAQNSPHNPYHVRSIGWAGAALCVALLALPSPASAAAPSLVSRAQQCYAAGDLGCVVTLLEGAALPEAEQPAADVAECWRLLGFSAARLDRHDLARRAFAAWIALPGAHRLERATTPPAVFQDYAAALIEGHAKELDLQPRIGARPQLPAPATTAADLPRFAPPLASQRDTANNFTVLAGLDVSTAPNYMPDSVLDLLGGSVGLEIDLDPAWRLGLRAGGLRYVGPHATIYGGTQTFLPYALLRVGRTLWAREGHRAELLLGFGGGARGRDGNLDAAALITPALRYTFRPDAGQALAALFVEASGSAVLADRFDSVLTCSIGVSLKPRRTGVGGP